MQGCGKGGELSLRGSSGLSGHHLGQTSGASTCSGPTSCRGRALGQRVARTHSRCLRLTGPQPRRTSTSCATGRPWSTLAALTTMQRNYRSPLLRCPYLGLRRGPSSSEPYRPSSSPPAQMLLLAEHSPPGSQRVRNIATPNGEPRTSLGEWVGRQAGAVARLCPPVPPGACFELSVPLLRFSCFFSWGGDGGKVSFFIH